MQQFINLFKAKGWFRRAPKLTPIGNHVYYHLNKLWRYSEWTLGQQASMYSLYGSVHCSRSTQLFSINQKSQLTDQISALKNFGDNSSQSYVFIVHSSQVVVRQSTFQNSQLTFCSRQLPNRKRSNHQSSSSAWCFWVEQDSFWCA